MPVAVLEECKAFAKSLAQGHGAQFVAVRDSRKRNVPGLYSRTGRFYGQLWMKGEKTARRFPLNNGDGEPIATLNDEREALKPRGAKPSLADYIETYFAKAEVARSRPPWLVHL